MTAAHSYAVIDWSEVDELAVEFACQGTPMALNQHERAAVVQRLGGQYLSGEIARRCMVSERHVNRILNSLGAQTCPWCRQLAFHDGDIVGRHIEWRTGIACPMTGEGRNDLAMVQRIAAARGAIRMDVAS